MKQLLLEKNLNNLTTLWKKLGAQQPAFARQSPDIFQSANWPNRYWLDAFSEADRAAFFSQHIETIPPHVLVPIWGINPQNDELLETALRTNGFEPVLVQTGMYLELTASSHGGLTNLDIRKVETATQTSEWTQIASASFGYAIDETVIAQLPSQSDIELLLVYHPEDNSTAGMSEAGRPQAIGTALLFTTGDTMGVHMIGVLPTGRGKGIAMQLMNFIIHKAKQLGCNTMTLQASAAGEGIYRKLGFQPQFSMRSFRKTI